MVAYLLVSIFPLLLLLAALSDLTSFRIPNLLNSALVIAFFPMALFVGMDISTFGWHLAAGGIVFIGTFGLFAVGWIGGGDAKMASAAALWIGFPQLSVFLVFTAMVGGILAAFVVLWNFIVTMPAFAFVPGSARLAKVTHLPYGIAIAGGGILTYKITIWVATFLP